MKALLRRLRQALRQQAALSPDGMRSRPAAGSDSLTRAAARARLGRAGEEAAARYLTDRGFVLLARNWRQGRLELDLICRDRDTLVFVEVKSRRRDAVARPDEALTSHKRRTLVRAARAWLAATGDWSRPCRFDVVSVLADDTDTLQLEHIPHAFDLDDAGTAVDRGHAPWQPW